MGIQVTTGAIVAAATLALLTPATASASAFVVRSDDCCTETRYDAAPGETNDVTLTTDGTTATLTDGGAIVGAQDLPPECSSTPHSVSCPEEKVRGIYFVLGDGNDHLTTDVIARVDGQEGDDVLFGSPDTDEFTSSQGVDQIFGGAGDDQLDEPYLQKGETAPVDPEYFDGGPGLDFVAYIFRKQGVTFDLRPGGLSGEPGEGDRLISVESVFGTEHDDTVFGTEADESALLGAGNDRAYGEGGFDEFFGEVGRDRLSGDAGPDQLDGGSGRDHAAGGEGDDAVAGDSGRDHLNGGYGNDSVSGGGGPDRVHGGPGDDWLHGAGDDDLLFGDSGNDVLAGDKPKFHRTHTRFDDRCDGGPGKDRVIRCRNQVNIP